MSTIKDNQNYLKNVDIDYRQYKHKTVETQLNKTPISLLNEWAMRGKNKYVVSYLLVAITGNTNKPKFTYVCRVNDIIGNLILIAFRIIKSYNNTFIKIKLNIFI